MVAELGEGEEEEGEEEEEEGGEGEKRWWKRLLGARPPTIRGWSCLYVRDRGSARVGCVCVWRRCDSGFECGR